MDLRDLIRKDLNTEIPLGVGFIRVIQDVNDSTIVDIFTSEKPCVAGSIPALSTKPQNEAFLLCIILTF